MQVLAHRGWWTAPAERNHMVALKRALEAGFGVETDIRDYEEALVISHDPPAPRCPSLLDLLVQQSQLSEASRSVLALNIKADGLASLLKEIFTKFPDTLYFAFDMSVPDMRSYISLNIPFFTRLSEVEQEPAYLEHAQGVWVDAFNRDWYDMRLVSDLLDQGKQVCVVSPELHRRPHLPLWGRLRTLGLNRSLMICTDFPEEAREYFYEQ